MPVQFADKYVPAKPSLPNGQEREAIAVLAVLKSGAQFTSLSVQIVEMLGRPLFGVPLRILISIVARQAVIAFGQHVTVTERIVPLHLAFTISWEAALLSLISFVIMPGSDGDILLGLLTL